MDLPYSSFFDSIEPVTEPVPWNGRAHHVTYAFPTTAEELQILEWVETENFEDNQRLLAESVARMAYAVVAVNGKAVRDDYKTFEERVKFVESFPGPLFKAIVLVWDIVRDMPITLANSMVLDSDFDSAPSENGASSSGAASTMDAS